MQTFWVPNKSDPDGIAKLLYTMGKQARSMPPAWDGAGVSHPAMSQDGAIFGKMLPGRGLYVDQDLRELGIKKHIPFVYERSITNYLMDAVDLIKDPRRKRGMIANQIGAISTYDGVILSRAGGKANDVTITKASITTVANAYSTLLRATGLPGAYTFVTIPTGEAPTRATAGALSLGLFNPSGSDKKYLLTFGYTAAQQINMAIVADLLVAAGNINANLNTSQTVSSTAITRNYTPAYGATAGPGVLMTFCITTQLGATPANLTVSSYTDQDGNTGATTAAIAMTASGIVERLQPAALGPYMEFAAGDFGVRAVSTVILSAAMGAGVIGLMLYFPLAFVPGIAANSYIERDATIQIDGLNELVMASGVLGFIFAIVLPNTTSTGVLSAFMRTCAG